MHNEETTQPSRLFLGLTIPDKPRKVLRKALQQYPKYLERHAPEENWHITLVFLGDVEYVHGYISRLTKPMPQAFLPTVSITHLGRGVQRDQLWAYCTPSKSLVQIRTELLNRLKSMRFPTTATKDTSEYIPHITLGHFFQSVRGMGVPDEAAITTFPVQEAYLFQSQATQKESVYTKIGTIPLTAS